MWLHCPWVWEVTHKNMSLLDVKMRNEISVLDVVWKSMYTVYLDLQTIWRLHHPKIIWQSIHVLASPINSVLHVFHTVTDDNEHAWAWVHGSIPVVWVIQPAISTWAAVFWTKAEFKKLYQSLAAGFGFLRSFLHVYALNSNCLFRSRLWHSLIVNQIPT